MDNLQKDLIGRLPKSNQTPIKMRDLADYLKINDREVRTIIEILRTEFNAPIASQTAEPAGYWWGDEKDIKTTARHYRNRADSEYKVSFSLENAHPVSKTEFLRQNKTRSDKRVA
jgi:hypothetical protein